MNLSAGKWADAPTRDVTNIVPVIPSFLLRSDKSTAVAENRRGGYDAARMEWLQEINRVHKESTCAEQSNCCGTVALRAR